MQEFIVGCVCCWLCALPLFITGIYGKKSKEPISFWAGDKIENIDNIKNYNTKTGRLYVQCAAILFVSPVFILINIYIFVGLICTECSLGIYLAYLKYKKILASCQKKGGCYESM